MHFQAHRKRITPYGSLKHLSSIEAQLCQPDRDPAHSSDFCRRILMRVIQPDGLSCFSIITLNAGIAAEFSALLSWRLRLSPIVHPPQQLRQFDISAQQPLVVVGLFKHIIHGTQLLIVASQIPHSGRSVLSSLNLTTRLQIDH